MTARWLRRLFNLYPPYLGAGVRVRHLADDFRTARVEVPLRWFPIDASGFLLRP